MSRQESVPAPAAAKGVTTVRTACPLAWLLPGLYAALTVLGLILQRLAGRPEDAVIGLAGDAALSAAILVSSLVGGLLAANRPANPIGWIMSATALVWALQQFCFGYAAYGLLAHPGSLPAAIPVGMLHVMMALLLELGIALLFLLFPDGRLPSARWRPVLWAGLAATAVLVPGWIVEPGPIGNLGVNNPVQVSAALWAILTPLMLAAFLLLFGVVLASVVSVLLRLRRASGEARQQLKWFAYATALMVLGFGLLFFGFDPNLPTDQIAMAVLVVASVAMPAAIAVAIFKYRLYAIDRIINRTIVYGLLTAILGLGYTGGVLLLGQALGRGRSNLAVAGATLAMAAAFQPARRRIQELVDRRFNRRRYDAAQTIQAFSARLRQQVDLEALTAELLAVVDQTMQPIRVSLWLRPCRARHRVGSATRRTVGDALRPSERIQGLLYGQQHRRRQRAERPAARHGEQCAGGRGVVRCLTEDIAVVVAEGVPEAVQLAPGGFQQGPDRLPTVLRLLDQLGPRLGRVAEPDQVQRHCDLLCGSQRRPIFTPSAARGNDHVTGRGLGCYWRAYSSRPAPRS